MKRRVVVKERIPVEARMYGIGEIFTVSESKENPLRSV
jgi:hypothetical protein